jgi:phosphoglycerol transferase MdoB-like AlkP superfamily enzyme
MRYEYSSSFRPVKTRVFFFIFLYGVAANIPLWIASRSVGLLMTGLFNVEFLIIGILSVFVCRKLTVGLLLVAIVLDIVRGINATYMLSPSEMLRSVRYLSEPKSLHLWDVVGVAICIALICLMAVLASSDRASGRERRFISLSLAVVAVLCGVVDIETGHTMAFLGDSQYSATRLTRLPAHALVMSELAHAEHESFKRSIVVGNDAPMFSASTKLAGLDTTSPRASATLPNVVLILVESWGKTHASDLEAGLVRPYADEGLSRKYTVSQGTVPFHGATVNGEARELCGSSMGFGLLTASASQLRGCLPARMNGMGYHTMGVHGFNSRMFDRGEWYSKIGFAESWFQEGLQRSGLPVCPGPFPGICDAAASVWIGDQLQRSSDSPEFIYWVTLNSHLPVPIPNTVKSPPSCEGSRVIAESPALCSWYQLEFNVHRSVAELAMRETARPTVFLVVGDHAPAFSSAKLRSQFSDEVVPYVLLEPRADGIKETLPKARSFVVAMRSPARMHRSRFRKISLARPSGGQ